MNIFVIKSCIVFPSMRFYFPSNKLIPTPISAVITVLLSFVLCLFVSIPESEFLSRPDCVLKQLMVQWLSRWRRAQSLVYVRILVPAPTERGPLKAEWVGVRQLHTLFSHKIVAGLLLTYRP